MKGQESGSQTIVIGYTGGRAKLSRERARLESGLAKLFGISFFTSAPHYIDDGVAQTMGRVGIMPGAVSLVRIEVPVDVFDRRADEVHALALDYPMLDPTEFDLNARIEAAVVPKNAKLQLHRSFSTAAIAGGDETKADPERPENTLARLVCGQLPEKWGDLVQGGVVRISIELDEDLVDDLTTDA